MSKLESQFRQNEIIKLAKRGLFDWKMLEEYLDRKSEDEDRDLRISKRTFKRDLNEIDHLYGLSIKFNFKTGMYELDEEESDEINTELLKSYDLIQAFQSKKNLKGKVFFEKRKATGTEHLKTIFNAIELQRQIKIIYKKFWQEELEERILKPFALKESINRWYVFVWDEKDHIKNFALDRIRDIEVLDRRVTFPPPPDLEKRFQETLGIINDPREPVEKVILTFTAFKGLYIKSMPLHESQTILEENEQTLTISLQVKINYELIAEILSHGDEVRVDAPERLKEQLQKKIQNMGSGQFTNYQN
jgi:predicted DNA-binding transcriptional regulator YafY